MSPAWPQQCGLGAAQVAEFFELFARTERVVTLFSQGVNQTSSGTDKVNAIINCHLLTGRIGRPGMGPFSLTGQPNAMGGREVGGLANQLAAHFELDYPAHRAQVREFWKSPAIASQPGLKAVDLFRAVEQGKIKVLWIMATNPAVSLPDAQQVRRALEKCELVIVSDCVRHTDTTQYAHVLLPAAAWGEKEGTVTNSERRISRQRAFLKPSGRGATGLVDGGGGGQTPRAWRRLRLPECRRHFPRTRGALGGGQRRHARFRSLRSRRSHGRRLCAARAGAMAGDARQTERHRAPVRRWGFFTPSGRARFLAITPRPPAHPTDNDYPLVLNTGRVRDHWHTMTRTGLAARLSAHTIEPYIEIHPQDAVSYGVADGTLARVASKWGQSSARVRVADSQRPGSVFVPMHWNDQFGSSGCIDAVVNPAIDPYLRRTGVQAHPGAHRAVAADVVRLSAVAPPADPGRGDVLGGRARAGPVALRTGRRRTAAGLGERRPRGVVRARRKGRVDRIFRQGRAPLPRRAAYKRETRKLHLHRPEPGTPATRLAGRPVRARSARRPG